MLAISIDFFLRNESFDILILLIFHGLLMYKAGLFSFNILKKEQEAKDFSPK